MPLCASALLREKKIKKSKAESEAKKNEKITKKRTFIGRQYCPDANYEVVFTIYGTKSPKKLHGAAEYCLLYR